MPFGMVSLFLGALVLQVDGGHRRAGQDLGDWTYVREAAENRCRGSEVCIPQGHLRVVGLPGVGFK